MKTTTPLTHMGGSALMGTIPTSAPRKSRLPLYRRPLAVGSAAWA